jgi:integrase
MVESDKNPGGTPIQEFDKLRDAVQTDRSQFWKDLSLTFYGYNRPGARISERYAMSDGSIAQSSTDYVFANSATGQPYTDVKKAFAHACRDAGIKDLRFHDLRHTFGTRLADAGVDVVKIKELMGHQSIETTMRYLHTTDKGKRAAITELAEYRRQRTPKSPSQGTDVATA